MKNDVIQQKSVLCVVKKFQGTCAGAFLVASGIWLDPFACKNLIKSVLERGGNGSKIQIMYPANLETSGLRMLLLWPEFSFAKLWRCQSSTEALRDVSGAHFNPAVTLAVRCSGRAPAEAF